MPKKIVNNVKRKNKEDLYEVEKILDKKTEDGHTKYLVKWDGYSERDSSLFS